MSKTANGHAWPVRRAHQIILLESPPRGSTDDQTDRQTSRSRRRFQPTLHGSLCSDPLEPRFLTAPFFTRSGSFNATLLAGSDSLAAGEDDSFAFGTGTGFDGTYQAYVAATTEIEGDYYDETGTVVLYAADDSASVTAKVTAPGTGLPGDRNHVTSAQIQINVKHTGSNSFTNNTATAFRPQALLGAGNSSKTTSGNQGGNSLSYVTGGTNGNATVTATFQATISSTGARDKFTDNASLTLNSTYLSVTISQANGLVATNANGVVILNDPKFENPPPFNDAQKVTVTVPKVANNTNLAVSYSSSLSSNLGVPGIPRGGNGQFPPGTTTDDTSFNWSLTYNIA